MNYLLVFFAFLSFSLIRPVATQAAWLPQQGQLAAEYLPVQPTKKAKKQKKGAKKQGLMQEQLSQESNPMDNRLAFAIIFAILLPCLGVYIWQQDLSLDFWITLILMLFFWIPGIIYALYVILAK